MLNVVTELLEGGLEIRHFIEPFSQRLAVRTHLLAYETRARSARGSQNCAILSIICPFTGNSAFWLCVNDIVVDLPRRKDATKVFAKLT